MHIEYGDKKRTINDLMRLSHLMLAVITLLWLNVGVYTYISNYIPNTIKLIIFATWFGIACFIKKNYLINYFVRILPLLIFFVILLVINMYTQSSAIELYISTFRYLFIVYSIFLYYFNDRNIKSMRIITIILLLDLLYIGVNTYLQLQINPSIARFLATSSEMQGVLLGKNVYLGIGSYSYAYSIVLIGLFILFYLIYGYKHKILNSLGVVAIIILLIKMQFTITILLLIICGFYLILAKIHSKNSYLMLFVFIPVLFIIYAYLPMLLNTLSRSEFIPEFMAVRFNEISLLFQGKGIEGTDLSIRWALYSMSLKTFFQNIFVGNLAGTIGNHSAWLDLLGRLGLLSTPLFIFFTKEYKFILSKLSKKSSVYVKASFLYYLILGIINVAFFAQIFVTLFILVPFCSFLYDRNEEPIK